MNDRALSAGSEDRRDRHDTRSPRSTSMLFGRFRTRYLSVTRFP
jgi:hypothetical protein